MTGGYDGLVKVWFVYMCVRLRVYGGSVRVHASLRTHASTCLCETHVLYLWHGEQAVATELDSTADLLIVCQCLTLCSASFQ